MPPKPRHREPEPVERSDAKDSELRYAYAAALELERRLYDNQLATLEKVYAQEGLAATFLPSGAVVAYAMCLQSFAQIESATTPLAATLVGTAFVAALGVGFFAAWLVALLFRGRDVADVEDAYKFLDEEPRPITRDEVDQHLMKAYASARERLKVFTDERTSRLMKTMGWVGATALIAFLALLGGIACVRAWPAPASTEDGRGSLHNAGMPNNASGSRPNPTPQPAPKGGTTTTKDNGGKGTETKVVKKKDK